MLLQTIGRGMQASVVAVSRQGLFFLPAVLILPHIFGLLGVQMSQTVSDILSFLLTIPMAISVLRQLGSPQKKDLTGDAEDVRGDIL
jgi:Na+-driven multidrug efflux pump